MNSGRRARTTQPARRALSLRFELTLLAIAVSSVPSVLLGVVLIDINREVIEQSLREHVRTVIEKIGKDVEVAFTETETTLDAVARTLAADELGADVRIRLARTQVSAHPAISDVAIYDARGELVAEIEL